MNTYRQSCRQVVDREVAYWRAQQRFMQQQAQRRADWERRPAEPAPVPPAPVPTNPPARPGWFRRLRAIVRGWLW